MLSNISNAYIKVYSFGDHPLNIGAMQRKLARSLCRDDTHTSRSVNMHLKKTAAAQRESCIFTMPTTFPVRKHILQHSCDDAWLSGVEWCVAVCGGRCSGRCCAVPCRAVPCRAVLCVAVLCCAVFCCAVVCQIVPPKLRSLWSRLRPPTAPWPWRWGRLITLLVIILIIIVIIISIRNYCYYYYYCCELRPGRDVEAGAPRSTLMRSQRKTRSSIKS